MLYQLSVALLDLLTTGTTAASQCTIGTGITPKGIQCCQIPRDPRGDTHRCVLGIRTLLCPLFTLFIHIALINPSKGSVLGIRGGISISLSQFGELIEEKEEL
jgi:hypothetical protein